MTAAAEAFAVLAAQLSDCETHWSLGTFGALAEFSRDAGEPARLSAGEAASSVVTARGGIRLSAHPGLRLFASESATTSGWSHRVSLCLPAQECGMGRRTVLTELGPDADALREQDRNAVLFDLGLGASQADACIRVSDPDLIAALRPCLGRPVFEHGNPAMGFIVAAGPHRVFAGRLGRIEVFQPIPPPHGKSPEGPHTHVLPRLLAHRRTHAATEPVPEGFVPCAHLYPAHPAKDGLGQPRPFDRARHESFQRLLERFGDPETVARKRQVAAAVTGRAPPSAVEVPGDRFARADLRVALRQMQAAADQPDALAPWLAVHDHAPVGRGGTDDPEAHHA